MAAIAFARQQLRHAVSIDIDQLERMYLRVGLVDHVLRPGPICARSLLLQPVKTVAMPLSVDDVRLAIVIYVVADDREAGIAQLPCEREVSKYIVFSLSGSKGHLLD
jgi:hypothetical protein